jgi:hypothetical protein
MLRNIISDLTRNPLQPIWGDEDISEALTLLTVASYLGYLRPYNLYQVGAGGLGKYLYDFDMDSKFVGDGWNVVTVSYLGNDTTGNGSDETPYASLSKAISAASGPTKIRLDGGNHNHEYAYRSTSSASNWGNPTKLYPNENTAAGGVTHPPLIIESFNGRATVSTRYTPASWSTADSIIYDTAAEAISIYQYGRVVDYGNMSRPYPDRFYRSYEGLDPLPLEPVYDAFTSDSATITWTLSWTPGTAADPNDAIKVAVNGVTWYKTTGYTVSGNQVTVYQSEAVKVRAAANISLASLIVGAVVDGVTLVANDQVLLTNQTNPADNGVYKVQPPVNNVYGPAVRSGLADTGTELANLPVYVIAGTSYGNTMWECTNSTITLGTTAVTFAQIFTIPTVRKPITTYADKWNIVVQPLVKPAVMPESTYWVAEGGTVLSLRLKSNRAPDSNVACYLKNNNSSGSSANCGTYNGSYLAVRNIDFRGGGPVFRLTQTGLASDQAYFDACTFKFCSDGIQNNLTGLVSGTVVVRNCNMSYSTNDGWNYFPVTGYTSVKAKIFELDCSGVVFGDKRQPRFSSITFNATTVHQIMTIERVNCRYNYALGPVVNEDTALAANYGVEALGSQYKYNIGIQGTSSITFLSGCYGVDPDAPSVGTASVASSLRWYLTDVTSNFAVGSTIPVNMYGETL